MPNYRALASLKELPMDKAPASFARLTDAVKALLGQAFLPLLGLTYSVLGPFACVYVSARIASWLNCGTIAIHLAALAGLMFFADIRIPLYRQLWSHRQRIMAAAKSRDEALRTRIWRSRRPYR
jgi:hypothetical protein